MINRIFQVFFPRVPNQYFKEREARRQITTRSEEWIRRDQRGERYEIRRDTREAEGEETHSSLQRTRGSERDSLDILPSLVISDVLESVESRETDREGENRETLS